MDRNRKYLVLSTLATERPNPFGKLFFTNHIKKETHFSLRSVSQCQGSHSKVHSN